MTQDGREGRNDVAMLRRALDAVLSRGDVTCELCDAGLAMAAAPAWPVLVGAPAFAGVARTVDAGHGDVPAVRAAVEALQAGEVLVVAAQHAHGAVFGDSMARAAAARGAAGVVVDGLVRDLPRLPPTGLAIRARGVYPGRASGPETGRADVQLRIGGIHVAPGDLVVVDANGVVAAAAERAEALRAVLHALAGASG